MTVHQIRLPEGHLKELYKATGNVTSTACLFMQYFDLSVKEMYAFIIHYISLKVLPEIRAAFRISIT